MDDARAPGASKLATLVNHSSCTAGRGWKKCRVKQGRGMVQGFPILVFLSCADSRFVALHHYCARRAFTFITFFDTTIYSQCVDPANPIALSS